MIQQSDDPLLIFTYFPVDITHDCWFGIFVRKDLLTFPASPINIKRISIQSSEDCRVKQGRSGMLRTALLLGGTGETGKQVQKHFNIINVLDKFFFPRTISIFETPSLSC